MAKAAQADSPTQTVKPISDFSDTTEYKLAMRVLQSDLYEADADVRDWVDEIIEMRTPVSIYLVNSKQVWLEDVIRRASIDTTVGADFGEEEPRAAHLGLVIQEVSYTSACGKEVSYQQLW